jgi:hypothetical protein
MVKGASMAPDTRRYPSTIGGACYLTVVAVAAAGIAVAAVGPWRTGVRIVGVGLVVAAVTRLVLPDRDAGMLAVRHRYLDAGILTAAGAALVALATSIPG